MLASARLSRLVYAQRLGTQTLVPAVLTQPVPANSHTTPVSVDSIFLLALPLKLTIKPTALVNALSSRPVFAAQLGIQSHARVQPIPPSVACHTTLILAPLISPLAMLPKPTIKQIALVNVP